MEIFDVQLFWRAAGSVQRLDGSSLGIIEETEGIATVPVSSFVSADFGYVSFGQ